MTQPFAFFDDQATGRQLYFAKPEEIISVSEPEDISSAFTKIEEATSNGKYIAGYFSYELGLALEETLRPRLKTGAPLIHVGVFDGPENTPPAELLYSARPPDINLTPDWSEADYLSRFETLQNYIASGDCYQVNLTFPMRGKTTASAAQIYAGYRQRQPGRYGAVISLGGADIISFSPELFFERIGQNMRMRPMKGTRPRHGENDQEIAEAMRAEPKSQAENLMIVDLLRNDLSRLATIGSVKVPELFALETYPTLYQMTSQVTATLRKGLGWQEIFTGLYPCGSVTGAPKIRAMEIIDELESMPRGPYCGAVGFIEPGGDACFNVAIRTAVLQDGELRYDVGSGVVSDSDGPDEYRECLLKSRIFTPREEEFIETLYWSPEDGYRHEAAHLARLEKATNRKFSAPVINAASPQRVRWVADHKGDLNIEATPYVPIAEPATIAISQYPLSSDVQRFDVKTTFRDFYDGERKRIHTLYPEIGEVLFCNKAGQLCEGSFTSLFLEKDGALLTPALSAGLLPGILRAKLIQAGKAKEVILTLDDLLQADQIYIGNSLRGLIQAQLFKDSPL